MREDLGMWSIYQSCNDLPFDIFKKCAVEKKYHLLNTGSDTIPPEILERAWISLYSEYVSIAKDIETENLISHYVQIAHLESKIFRVKMYCKMLFDGYNAAAAAILKEMYGYPFTTTSYLNNVESTLRKLNNQEVELGRLVKYVNDKTTKANTADNPNPYAIFDHNIHQIEIVFKVPVDTTKLTAQMYAVKLCHLKEEIARRQHKEPK